MHITFFFSIAGALKTTTERPSYLNSQLEKSQQQKKSTAQSSKNKPGSAEKQKQNNAKRRKEKKKPHNKVEINEGKKETNHELSLRLSANTEQSAVVGKDQTERTEQDGANNIEDLAEAVENVTLGQTKPKRPESSQKRKKAECQKSGHEKKKLENVPKPAKVKKPKSVLEKASKDDFEALIEAAQQENMFCHFSGCKQRSSLLGQTCEFCAQRFCLNHHIPEVHGCGNEARANARRVLCRDGVLYRGSGVPDKKPDQAKRNYLQRKLEKKVGEMEANRKHKKKEKS